MLRPNCLVCEDEPWIALDLQKCVTDNGMRVIGPFTTSTDALRWIETSKAPDIALLNFKLNDGACTPLIYALQARGVPIVMQSGLSPDADMPPEVRGLPWLSKPVSDDDLRKALAQAMSALSLKRAAQPVGRFGAYAVHSTPDLKSEERPLTHVLSKRLTALCPLNEREREKLEAAVARTFEVDAGHDVIVMGRQRASCHVLLDGMAAPYRLLPDGRRQITRFAVPGDLLDLDGFVGGKMDHSVATLGRCTVGVIPHQVLRVLSREHPAIGMALWRHTLADTAVFREWVVNVGQRLAQERIAHVMCEVFTRLRDAGLASEINGRRTFTWPLTQTNIADATGITPVHVSRSLQALRGSGLIELSRTKVTILDWDGLVDMSGFETDYLHPVLPGSEARSHSHM